MLVVDEADLVLSDELWDKFKGILNKLPKEVQIVLLLATMPQNFLDMTKDFMKDPLKVFIKKKEVRCKLFFMY